MNTEQMVKTENNKPLSIPQGSLLWPLEPFTFGYAGGRSVKVSKGQSFWVVNTRLSQINTGVVQLAQSGSKYPYNFTIADIHKFFELRAF